MEGMQTKLMREKLSVTILWDYIKDFVISCILIIYQTLHFMTNLSFEQLVLC